MIIDGWVKNLPGVHPAVPYVSLVLVVLSILVAVETVVAVSRKLPDSTDPSRPVTAAAK